LSRKKMLSEKKSFYSEIEIILTPIALAPRM
jgi:hypothetical protein